MNTIEKLKELKDLERTLESEIERILETKEELNLKETIYKQQLHFVRGQIALLESIEETQKFKYEPLSGETSKPENYKNPLSEYTTLGKTRMWDLIEKHGPSVEVHSDSKTGESEEQQFTKVKEQIEEVKGLDPFPGKGTKLTGMTFVNI